MVVVLHLVRCEPKGGMAQGCVGGDTAAGL